MKSSIAIAALVLTSLALNPGTAAARGGGHGQIGAGQAGQTTMHAQSAWWGRGYGYGRYGRGWCYWHPYSCYNR